MFDINVQNFSLESQDINFEVLDGLGVPLDSNYLSVIPGFVLRRFASSLLRLIIHPGELARTLFGFMLTRP